MRKQWIKIWDQYDKEKIVVVNLWKKKDKPKRDKLAWFMRARWTKLMLP